jgi:transmembrane sensor
MVKKPPKDLASEAAQWFVRWSDTSETAGSKEQSRWFAWLQRSPRHVAAYFAMDDMNARLGESPALKDFDVDAWLASRRAPVMSLQAIPVVLSARPEVASRHPRWLRWASAAVLATIVVGGAAIWHLSTDAPSYRTGVGEQKTVRLADGSVLKLNTRSQARVAFTEGAREIQLEGEALFTVAKDVRRPFRVRTHDATVQAIGTRFNVYQQDRATRVAVLEGRVRVSSAPQNPSFDLAAGEEAKVIHGIARKESKPNVKVATAWQNRTLVFERAQLSEVAREFNRYNALQLQVDPATGETNRLSGTFDARHPESLLLWLQSRADIAVTREENVYVVRDRGKPTIRP